MPWSERQVIEIGSRFGRLTTTGPSEKIRLANGLTKYRYPVACDCGKIFSIDKGALSGRRPSQSCGCLRDEKIGTLAKTHGAASGHKKTRLYARWKGMSNRCNNPKCPQYPRYGGRGIKICQEWSDFAVYREWAEAHGYQEDLQIDRIDTDGDYRPDNCRWVTPKINCDNRSTSIYLTAFGETKVAADWLRDPRCAIKGNSLYYRIEQGWSDEDVITTPPRPRIKHKPHSRTA